MGAKKARLKLARKVILAVIGDADGVEISNIPATWDLDDREFDRLVQEIRNARVTVTWPDEKGRK